jgi:hypothetical protein
MTRSLVVAVVASLIAPCIGVGVFLLYSFYVG